ncbi:uncharacterized protein [Montipora foliosa]|uniref:uncharacterized protein n=1 Tax=Montipora foliosa TaxID=591990 RepID=UPI0035F1404B
MALTHKRKALIAFMVLELLGGPNDRVKRGKTSEWLKERSEKGIFQTVIQLSLQDTPAFKEMMRMSPDQFKEILNAIEPDICKQSTKMGGEPIIPSERLALTLRFLATGESFRSHHFQFRISRPAVSYIVTEVCEAITKRLGPSYLKVPSSEQEWLQIAKQFEEKRNFPNAWEPSTGSILPSNLLQTRDLIIITVNRHTHSIVLLAIAGPDCDVLYADVGTNGRVSDGGISNKCCFLKALEGNKLGIPPSRPLLPSLFSK